MQMTPARRLFYILSFFGFVLGVIVTNKLWIFCTFIVLNLLLALELADKLTTRDELEIAREIQVSLQPEQIPESHWLSISFSSKPAKIVEQIISRLAEFVQSEEPHDDVTLVAIKVK